MKRFEYLCLDDWHLSSKKITEKLNEYGQQGWELVCAWSGYYYFKREIREQ